MERTRTEASAWLTAARQRLVRVENPGLEAQVILGHVLHQSRAALMAHPERELTSAQLAELDHLLSRRLSGEPLPYLLGRWEFFGLEFLVTPAVLIPRPETELLIEKALGWLNTHPDKRRAADVGVGSGAISAALLTRIPDLRVTAVDVSFQALQVAKTNLAAHGVLPRCMLAQSDLLTACRGPFDLICANLPYIPSGTLSTLDVVRSEPSLALDGGPDGLRLIERLLADASRLLAPDGLLLLEIEATQGESAPALARSYFPTAVVELHLDLAGLPRLVSVALL